MSTSVQLSSPTTCPPEYERFLPKIDQKLGPIPRDPAFHETLGEEGSVRPDITERRRKGTTMNPKKLFSHLLSHLYRAQMEGRRITLDDLVKGVEVRRVDVRKVLSTMHQQNLIDVRVMRLTLMGFALASSLDGEALPVLRRPAATRVAAA